MRRKMTWRVRVTRKIEDWVDVQADTALQAEQLAASIPNVISVFGRSAMRGDKPVDFIPAQGAEDDDE